MVKQLFTRFMQYSLSNLVDNFSEINNNKDLMMTSLTQSTNKISQVDQKIAQIDKQEHEIYDNITNTVY